MVAVIISPHLGNCNACRRMLRTRKGTVSLGVGSYFESCIEEGAYSLHVFTLSLFTWSKVWIARAQTEKCKRRKWRCVKRDKGEKVRQGERWQWWPKFGEVIEWEMWESWQSWPRWPRDKGDKNAKVTKVAKWERWQRWQKGQTRNRMREVTKVT